MGVLKSGFWPGVAFTDLDDLNAQALAWCDRLNGQPACHDPRRARAAPGPRNGLRPLPTDWAWERFATEERKVSWDGYVSYDGVLYGLPAHLPDPALPRSLAGATVQVRERAGQVLIWSAGQQVLVVAKHAAVAHAGPASRPVSRRGERRVRRAQRHPARPPPPRAHGGAPRLAGV